MPPPQDDERPKLLLVDDEPELRTIARMCLEQSGHFEVVEVASGLEALECVDSERPDVILLDVLMPYLDGPATLQRLRERATTAHVPVIFLTAKTRASDVARFRELGAAGVIAKPFDPTTLSDEVLRILAPST